MRLPILVLTVAMLCAADAQAQQVDTTSRRQPLGARLGDARVPSGGGLDRTARGTDGRIGTPHYDVVLEIPELTVDSIGLEVDGLRAHLALDAQVASLVMLTAGVDVTIEEVSLEITGVLAEVYLYVDLDNVAYIVDRAITTLENNPQILEQLLATVDTAVGVVGRVGGTALQPGGVVDQAVGTVGRTLENVTAPGGLLTQTVDAAGRTVQTVLTTSGSIVQQTLDATGGVLSQRTLGSVTRLPLLSETTNAAGDTVRRVRDTAGNVIEYTLGSNGVPSALRVVERVGQ